MSRWQPRRRKYNRRVTDRNAFDWQRWFAPLKSMSVLALVAGVGYGLWFYVTDPATLPLKQVQIDAPFQHVPAGQLREVVSKHAGGGFFNVDIAEVTSAVEALSWVDRASVRRVWPDTLAVSVVEQKPLARWSGGGLVNERGELFFPKDMTGLDDLVVFEGDRSAVVNMARRYREIAHQLGPVHVGLSSVTLTSRRSWELGLDNGISVMLGRNETETRLRRFVRFYPGLSAKLADVVRIDMRYPNGFAVKWRQAYELG